MFTDLPRNVDIADMFDVWKKMKFIKSYEYMLILSNWE